MHKGFPEGVNVVFGVAKPLGDKPLKIQSIGDKPLKIQSIRFKADRWTTSAAKKWLRDHGFKTTAFVPVSSPTTRRAPTKKPVPKKKTVKDASAKKQTRKASLTKKGVAIPERAPKGTHFEVHVDYPARKYSPEYEDALHKALKKGSDSGVTLGPRGRRDLEFYPYRTKAQVIAGAKKAHEVSKKQKFSPSIGARFWDGDVWRTVPLSR